MDTQEAIVIHVVAVLVTSLFVTTTQAHPDACQKVKTALELREELILMDRQLKSLIEQITQLRQELFIRIETQKIIRKDLLSKPKLTAEDEAAINQAWSELDTTFDWVIGDLELQQKLLGNALTVTDWAGKQSQINNRTLAPREECAKLWSQFKETQKLLDSVLSFSLINFFRVAQEKRLFNFDPLGRLKDRLQEKSPRPASQMSPSR